MLAGRAHLRLRLLVADFGEPERATDRAERGLAFVEFAVDLFGRRHRVTDHRGTRQSRARDRDLVPIDAPSSGFHFDQVHISHSGGTTKVTASPGLATTLVTAMPRPLVASVTDTPNFGVVAVTSTTGKPPDATVTTARPITSSCSPVCGAVYPSSACVRAPSSRVPRASPR